MPFPASSGFLTEFTNPTANVGREMYLRALANAMGNPIAVPDPSYALGKDLNVYELVRHDAHCKKVMDLRKHAVAGTEWHCSASRDENPLDEAAAKLGDAFIKCIENFDGAKLNLAQAVFFGSAFAKIVGRRVTKTWVDGQPREWWVPEWLVDVDRRRIRWQATKPGGDPALHMGSIEGEEVKWKRLEHPEWMVQHVYDESESTLGYGRGLLDAIYQSWYAKTRIVIETLQACERFGQGLLVAKVQSTRAGSTVQTNTNVLTDAANNIAATRARHVLACFTDEEIEAINGLGEGWQLLLQTLKYEDDAITGVVLGSVLPSGGGAGGAGEGGQGSMARARVEEGTTDTVIRFDRRLLAASLTRGVIGLCWRLNRANIIACGLAAAERPTLDLSHESRETPAEFSDLLKKAQDAGVQVKKSEAYKRLGLTMPKPGDLVLEPLVQVPAGFGGGGEGGGGPQGEEPSASTGPRPTARPEPAAA